VTHLFVMTTRSLRRVVEVETAAALDPYNVIIAMDRASHRVQSAAEFVSYTLSPDILSVPVLRNGKCYIVDG
jgi:hypothetical protein